MSEGKILSEIPIQITTGKNFAHVTVRSGTVLYADALGSTAWHHLKSGILYAAPPVAVWMRAGPGANAEICISNWES